MMKFIMHVFICNKISFFNLFFFAYMLQIDTNLTFYFTKAPNRCIKISLTLTLILTLTLNKIKCNIECCTKMKSWNRKIDTKLQFADFSKKFRLESDASQFGVSGVLSQQHGKNWLPIAFFSNHLSKTERNYSASEREMLAIVLSSNNQ